MGNFLISPKPFSEMTKEEFFAQLLSLKQKRQTKESQAVPGITVTFTPRVMVKVAREPKTVTQTELAALSVETGQTYEFLYELFSKKKIAVHNVEGKRINEPVRKERKKGNAKRRTVAEREDAVPAELLEHGLAE